MKKQKAAGSNKMRGKQPTGKPQQKKLKNRRIQPQRRQRKLQPEPSKQAQRKLTQKALARKRGTVNTWK
jgi:hypothetical protein